MSSNSRQVVILGSTGSVGKSTLDVIARHPEDYSVLGLSANTNVEDMAEQCRLYQPQRVVMADSNAATELRSALDRSGVSSIEVDSGATALAELSAASEAQIIMSAIVGAAGLMPTLAAVQAGKNVLIANKEPLVMTGDLFMAEARKSGATILPIDSEHNAIFQCLPEDLSKRGVRRLHLTASGGPFRGRKWGDLSEITPEQACAHPNWSMGQKISVDSATMMNKGLELIEASALFGISASDVEIVVHPQSIIHSMVEYVDGSFLAQLGAPDMRIPIAHALAWPMRIESGAKSLDITEISTLDFEKPDMENLPCLSLARHAAEQGGAMPAILNAANEVAVGGFLERKIPFTDIPNIIDYAMSAISNSELTTVADVLQIDNESRLVATARLNSISQ